MSGTGAELATRALIAHLPAVLITRVEENSILANTDCVPLVSFGIKCLNALCGNTDSDAVNCIVCL